MEHLFKGILTCIQELLTLEKPVNDKEENEENVKGFLKYFVFELISWPGSCLVTGSVAVNH